ncbi:MAG TPA: SCO family protein [Thermoanaerobaculia bacterium]|nr:SCO family protein [Thermoanaerobaculia bacterium]
MKPIALVLALSLCAASAPAQDHQHHHPAPAPPPPSAKRAFTVPDVEVQTQAGESLHFYRDLVQGKVVAMNFVFTSCTTVCPTMGATFARVQKMLGERGSEVALISVSIDPANDTPERLAAWSQRLGGKPGWTLVTGNRTDINEILKSLGLFTADPAAHSPVVLVANEPEGRWERVDGLATPTAIVEAIGRMEGKGK